MRCDVGDEKSVSLLPLATMPASVARLLLDVRQKLESTGRVGVRCHPELLSEQVYRALFSGVRVSEYGGGVLEFMRQLLVEHDKVLCDLLEDVRRAQGLEEAYDAYYEELRRFAPGGIHQWAVRMEALYMRKIPSMRALEGEESRVRWMWALFAIEFCHARLLKHRAERFRAIQDECVWYVFERRMLLLIRGNEEWSDSALALPPDLCSVVASFLSPDLVGACPNPSDSFWLEDS
jgi:hypothetical protein